MTAGEVALLVVAGVAAGLSGSMAGLASLFSYPALLAVGLSATTANVTNTVALTVNGLGAAAGSRAELSGQGDTVGRYVPVVAAGGAAGAALLLLTPVGAFERVVPFLVGGASAVLLVQPRIRAAAEARVRSPDSTHPAARSGRVGIAAGLFAVSLYGGYFGAAAGVMMLALLLVGLPVSTLTGNALKNVLLGVANTVAAVGFAFLGPVDWAAVVPLAAGLVVGSYAGPAVARRLPDDVLRIGIGLAGLGLAAALAIDAY